MTVDSTLVPIDPEDSFLLAVERLEAGVALEVVLADFSVEEREELRELLTVVAATHHLQEIDIPRPTPERRAAGRRTFLQAAATMRSATAPEVVSMAAPATAQLVTERNSTDATASSVRSRAVSRPIIAPPTVGSRLAAWWTDLLRGLAPTSLRLAPLVAMLAAIWLGAFSAVNVAQAAIPGQAAYMAKTWIFAQKLTLSAEEDRTKIYIEFTDQFKTDNALAGELAAKENKIVPSQADLVIESIGRTHIEMGGLRFELSYRKSLDSDQMIPTTIMGLPAEGAQAHIEYQIVPDPNGPPGATVLQGISLTIEEEPLVIPTAVPTTVESTTPMVTNRSCTVEIPAGWVTYRVPGGISLSAIAQQTGTSVVELTRVNCIANPNRIQAGEVIMVPMAPAIITTPIMPTATTPPLVATLTGISTTQPTPLITVTMPAEGTPTVAITPTVGFTPVVTVTPAVVITATLIATTTTPVATPEPSATVSVTTTAVVTPIATPNVTPVISETLALTPVETTTEESVEPTGEATPVAPLLTVTPTPTADATADQATAIATAVAAPTVAETAAASATPDEVGGASTDEGDESAEEGGTQPNDTATALPPPTATPLPVATASSATVLPTSTTVAEGRTSGGNSGDSRDDPLPTATPTAANSSPLIGSGAFSPQMGWFPSILSI